MSNKTNKLFGSSASISNDLPIPVLGAWRQDGPFIVDGAGKRIAQMQGDPAQHEWSQRRILAAVNALQDTPTQFVEELLEKCNDNIILSLLSRDREMAAALRRMEDRIAAHCREIEQLRETMDVCRIFEKQRALLQQTPGSAEYEALLRTLGIR
jgi:hypothetical protein